MRLREVLAITEANLLLPQADLDSELDCAFASDLMSDVLRFDLSGGLLITGLTNPQVVRTAEIAEAGAILMVRGKAPHPETLYLAAQVGVPILSTEMIMFEACGRLHQAGMPACVAQNAGR